VRFGAVIADVCGVFLVPHEEPVTQALATVDVDVEGADFERAHFRGVAAVDSATGEGEDKERYLAGYVEALAVQERHRRRATVALLELWGRSSVGLWRRVLPKSVRGLRLLAEHRIPLAIVSNSDGTVEEQLRRHDICQVGVGPGVTVLAIIDSAVVGVAKPDPRAFAPAIAALGLPPGEVAFVGDSVKYDVLGAQDAGLVPVHFDPLRTCRSDHRHRHIRAIADLLH
jgi:putative hydrolase of the HAD superfamily